VSVRVESRSGGASGTELHAIHMPNKSRGDAKIESFEAVARYVAGEPVTPRIVLGDLNSPFAELPDGSMLTFGQHLRPDGRPSRAGNHLDLAERSVLGAGGRLADAFRSRHGYATLDHTWIHRRHGVESGFRLDHVLTEAIDVAAIEYRHEVRQLGLSDHSLLFADLRSRPTTWRVARSAGPPRLIGTGAHASPRLERGRATIPRSMAASSAPHYDNRTIVAPPTCS